MSLSDLQILKMSIDTACAAETHRVREFLDLPDATPVSELVEICAEVIQTETAARLTPEIAQRILALVDVAPPGCR